MNFIQSFLRAFDPRLPLNEYNSIIDHGDPDALFMSPPILLGSTPAKPPGSLVRFASEYGGPRRAPNGEGLIDARSNYAALRKVAQPDVWRAIEADALAAHDRWET